MPLPGPEGLKFRSVLVIGGASLVGIAACKALSNSGYVPIAYDQARKPKSKREKWGPFVHGSVTDKERLAETFSAYHPDALVICRDLKDVRPTATDTALAYRTALSGTLHLLDLAEAHKIRDIVYVSSADIYGDAGPLPISESQPIAPIAIAGSCHMICERMISDFAQSSAMRFAILRGFAIAGCDDDLAESFDEDPSFPNQLMAVAMGLRPHIALRSANLPTRDGTLIRDYTHSTDFADALVLALRSLELGATSRIYNLGSGIGTSALELVHLAERVSGHRIPIVHAAQDDNQVATLISDSSLARVMLGWTPKRSAADQIIQSLWTQWHARSRDQIDTVPTRIAG